jgi:hypothetical protein
MSERTRDMTLEWAVLSDHIAVVACETGEFWLSEVEQGGDVSIFSAPMTGAGSPGSTRSLLDGVVAFGLKSDAEVLHPRPTTVTLPKYVLDLVSSYHNSRRTVGNYIRAANRFKAVDRSDVATYLERHAREENGHERLALRDLKALGFPAERIVSNLVPRGVADLCSLFDNMSSSHYPIGCIGYSYFFEASAATRHRSHIEALQALCPTGADATRFMRAHSSLGSEVDHVFDMIKFISTLPASDRTEIAKAVYLTATTASQGIDLNEPMTDEDMWKVIRDAAGEEIDVPA